MSALPHRRSEDFTQDYFAELRAELGRFWLLWILSMPTLAAVGCFLMTQAGRSLLLAIWS